MNPILVVDDSPMMRLHLSKVLSRAHYTVRAVDSGKAALKSYQAQSADLVILDIIMPDMDGIETLQALRAIDSQVKVLGISGLGPCFSSLYLNMLRKLGAQESLEKPFTNEVLLDAVRQLIGPASRTNPLHVP